MGPQRRAEPKAKRRRQKSVSEESGRADGSCARSEEVELYGQPRRPEAAIPSFGRDGASPLPLHSEAIAALLARSQVGDRGYSPPRHLRDPGVTRGRRNQVSDQSDDYPPVVKLAPGKWVIAIALGADIRLSRGGRLRIKTEQPNAASPAGIASSTPSAAASRSRLDRCAQQSERAEFPRINCLGDASAISQGTFLDPRDIVCCYNNQLRPMTSGRSGKSSPG